MDETPAVIGDNLKQARRRAGLSQAAVAQRLYFRRETISRYETGTRSPDPETISELGMIYQVDTAAFSSPNPLEYF